MFPRGAVRPSAMGFEVVFLVWWVYLECIPSVCLLRSQTYLYSAVLSAATCSNQAAIKVGALASHNYVQRTTMPIYINICSILSGLITPLDSRKANCKVIT